jgi:drug/metabolite transporter (DMT)-like permease
MSKKRLYLYISLTIIFWSLNPAFVKIALKELDYFQLLTCVSVIGVIAMGIINYITGRWRDIEKYNKIDYLKMCFIGFIGVFAYHFLLYSGFSNAPAGLINLINYLWPSFMILFTTMIFKEKIRIKLIIPILIGFLGVTIIVLNGNFIEVDQSYSIGFLKAFGAAICYGLFSVLVKKGNYGDLFNLLIYNVIGMIFILIFTILYSEVIFPKFPITIITVLFIGVLVNSISFLLWFKVLKYGNTFIAANSIYLVPFLALLWTWIINSEKLNQSAIIGVLFIASGLFIQVINNTKLTSKT